MSAQTCSSENSAPTGIGNRKEFGATQSQTEAIRAHWWTALAVPAVGGYVCYENSWEGRLAWDAWEAARAEGRDNG